jgi:hypothetical protein
MIMTIRESVVAVTTGARRRYVVLERWETRGKRSYTTGYVMRETSRHPAVFRPASRPRRAESPTVDAICRIVGCLMLAVTVALFWIMATAT